MDYGFDRVIDRRGTFSLKWDARSRFFDDDEVLPLWVADMDFASPPEVVASLKERIDHGVFGYASPPADYRRTVVEWMARRHRWTIQEEWVVPTGGVVFDIMVALRGLTAAGDTVVIQPPVYFPFFSAVTRSNRELATNPLRLEGDRYGMDLEDLERHFTNGARCLLLCSPHNPGGMVWTEEELGRLAELCVRHDVLVISDEIHCDLVLSGARHRPTASLSQEMQQRTVTLGAPSKTFNIPSLAASHAVIADDELRKGFVDEMSRVGIGGPRSVMGMVAQQTAYKSCDGWLDAVIGYLDENRSFLLDYFARRIPRIRPMKPDGTYLVWLDCRDLGLDDEELNRFMLKKAGLALSAGIRFGDEGSGFMRLNFACPRSVLREALEKLQRAVSAL